MNREDIIFLPATEESKAHVDRAWSFPCAMNEKNWPEVKQGLLNGHVDTDLPNGIDPKSNLTCEIVNDTKVYTFSKSDEYEKIILYFHGGAYVFDTDPLHTSIADKLACCANAKVVMPCYKLAPEYTYKEAFELADVVYEILVAEGKEITIMGDSAGAGIAFGFVHYAKEKSIKLPDKMLLISPWVDVEMENPDIAEYQKNDPFLHSFGLKECGKWWAGDKSVTDPMISPKFGGMDNMPRTLMFVGTGEIFYPDIYETYEKMKAAGTDVTLVVAEGLTHVYALVSLEQSKKCQKMMVEFV